MAEFGGLIAGTSGSGFGRLNLTPGRAFSPWGRKPSRDHLPQKQSKVVCFNDTGRRCDTMTKFEALSFPS